MDVAWKCLDQFKHVPRVFLAFGRHASNWTCRRLENNQVQGLSNRQIAR